MSPFNPDTKLAAKLVTFSMYSLADIPAVLNALFAFSTTISEEFSKSFCTPPIFCSREATLDVADFAKAENAVTPLAARPPTALRLVLATDPILPNPVCKPSVSSFVPNTRVSSYFDLILSS